MNSERKTYPDDHWLKSKDPKVSLQAYLEQQNKAYSKTKNAFIGELLGDLQDKRVLDYGCGAGWFTVLAAERGAAQVIGVDAEETALGTARYFADLRGVGRACSFIRSDHFPKSLRRMTFDVMLMKDVIEHVPDDQALLHAASKVVAPGGKLILSTQNALSLNYLIQGTYRRKWLKEKDWYGWDPTHLRFYTPITLDFKLKEAGFRAVGWRSVYIIPYKLPAPPGSKKQFLRIDALSWVDKKLGSFFPYNRLGWNVIVAAEASPLVSQKIGMTPSLRESVPSASVVLARESRGK